MKSLKFVVLIMMCVRLCNQVLSMQKQWNAYRGEVVEGTGKRGKRCNSNTSKVFTMRSTNKKNEEAEVFLQQVQHPSKKEEADFRIKGCFRRRNCVITSGSSGQPVAKIARKKANNSTVLLGEDVFSLVVQPGFEIDLVMAMVVVLDRICGQPSYAPVLCS